MSMISFDTLKLARRLREAGMPSEQAEAVAEAEAEALGEFVQSHLATKSDVADLKQEITDCRSELKQEIADCRSELKQEITDCRNELKQEIADVRLEIGDVRREIADCRSELKTEISGIIKWNVGTMIALVAIMLAVLRLTG